MLIDFDSNEHEPIKWLKVMADYECGLWDYEGCGFDLEDLGAPQGLIERFNSWLLWQYQELDRPEDFDREAFTLEGRHLAEAIKEVVGPDVEVVYYDEVKNVNRPVEAPQILERIE